MVSALFLWQVHIQSRRELDTLYKDLSYRTQILSDNIIGVISEKGFSKSILETTLRKISSYEKIEAISFYDNSYDLIWSETNPKSGPLEIFDLSKNSVLVGNNNFELFNEDDAVFVYPVIEGDVLRGYLSITQDTKEFEVYLQRFWLDNAIRLGVFLFFLTLMYWLVYYVFISKPTKKLIELIYSSRKGIDINGDFLKVDVPYSSKLKKEVFYLIKSFQQARKSAKEEAEFRSLIIDSPWTLNRLERFFKNKFENRKIINITNREPYEHLRDKNGVFVKKSSHGMISSLDLMMQANGGTWIAQGSGSEDKSVVNPDSEVKVPIENPSYTLKRIWLTEEEIAGYYSDFSNEALFPLSLMTYNRPIFRESAWEMYKKVNKKFADVTLESIKNVINPIIFIHDLHFSLLPKMIKDVREDAEIIFFWHHPFPSFEQFNICPYKKEILEGILGANVVGFHIQHYCNNFIDNVKNILEVNFNKENDEVMFKNRSSLIRSFPFSIPFTQNNTDKKIEKKTIINGIEFGKYKIVLGVDRMDYSKGFMERLKGIEIFFEKYPEMIKKIIFIQIAAPSRESVKKFRDYSKEVLLEVERINKKIQTSSWRPIQIINKNLTQEDLLPYYEHSDVCLVSSLHDGMNLVAKEYVSLNRVNGVLILSEFTGAARELKEALKINPYNPNSIADSIKEALKMRETEKKSRLESMKNKVINYNAFRWAAEIFNSLNEHI